MKIGCMFACALSHGAGVLNNNKAHKTQAQHTVKKFSSDASVPNPSGSAHITVLPTSAVSSSPAAALQAVKAHFPVCVGAQQARH